MLAIILMFWMTPVCAEPILVFAASSLKGPLDKIVQDFEAQSDHTVTVSYAASSILARQIAFGAPADIFVSANTQWTSYLVGQGMIEAGDTVKIAGNSLVLAAKTPAQSLALNSDQIVERLQGGKLAVPLIEAVPLGQYAAQAFEKLDILADLIPYLAQQDSARASLVALQRGDVPLAVLYASDLAQANDLTVVAQIDPDLHDQVRYQTSDLGSTPIAGEFMTYLTTDQAQAVFMQYGFTQP